MKAAVLPAAKKTGKRRTKNQEPRTTKHKTQNTKHETRNTKQKMPITFSYSDPEPLGEYAYYAAGRRQRRENLDRSIDRQLAADRANASLALNYEQLYGNLAQRELDRQTGLAESAADRNFRRDQQAAAQTYATDQATTAHRRDLEILDARQAAELRGDDARRQRDLDRANGVIAQLKKEKAGGLWLGREADYERELRKLEWEARGLAAPPTIPERPLTAQEEFDKNVVTLPDGRTMFRRGDGKFDDLGGTPADPSAEIRRDFDKFRELIIAARNSHHRAQVEAWKDGGRVGPYPQLPLPPTYEEIRNEVEAYRNSIEGELQRRQRGEPPASQPPQAQPGAQPPTSADAVDPRERAYEAYFQSLPPGAQFIDPDGNIRRKEG
jgi:hypothetical protein